MKSLDPKLQKRIQTALILGGAVALALLLADWVCEMRWLVVGVLVLVLGLTAWEFAGIVVNRRVGPSGRWTPFALAFSPSLVFAMLSLFGGGCPVWLGLETVLRGLALILVLSLLGTLLVIVLRSRLSLDPSDPLVPLVFGGTVYFGICFPCLVALALMAEGPALVAWLILSTAANDIAAYFGGSKIPPRWLAPGLSPKKTIGGSFCGLAAGVLVGILGGVFLLHGIGIWESLALSLVVAIAVQIGDLFQSWIKRLGGVKDAGGLLPGHGGFFDRIDGLLVGAMVLTGGVVVFTLF